MWGRLAEPRTVVDLVRDLQARFPALSAQDAERDVTGFLDELSRHAMVAVGA